jgi:hypothetical protein
MQGEIYNMAHASLWIAFALYILYETSAVYEYSRFLPDFLTKRKRYLSEAKDIVSYGDFMRMTYDSFAMRLITCPTCSGVWMSAACAAITQEPVLIPAIYLCSQLVYRGFTTLVNTMERASHGND